MTDQGRIVRCPQCGTKNRIRDSKQGQRPICGKCKAPLEGAPRGPAGPVTVTDANFTREVLESPLPVLLDCWAAWCGPCRTLGPIVDKLAKRWQGRIKVGKLNVDQNPNVASQFQIRSIPTMLVFERGRLKDTLVGALPEGEIVRRMAPYMNA